MFYSSTLEDRLAKLSRLGLIENQLVEITFFLFYPEFIPILYNNKHIGDNVVQMNVVIPVMLSNIIME